ncbi:hypothetical protein M406DRAFT_45043 [Cryphonectria parasitica EP155]|uniref:Rhodopsin domain-containing protein n=1 Tax=Cryphonectria parasitica (strain ATCC 38755 / EP155) TaxID=660469 RepID=A0A9P4Y918_CRYP1|nr:uncharacterized protein M406DRAFT_45043 [Cryphonectria parasitica EP155]KAF3768644.1 hypothetical protein M406DRAFT_45043 [Cryphonectria parasitica EP155]
MPEVGLVAAPVGETSDFSSISDLQVTILIVFLLTSSIATLTLILRLYTGAFLVRTLKFDAFFLFSAWAVYLSSFITMVRVMPCGFGKHAWNITESGYQCYKSVLLFLGVSYFFPPALVKLSVVILYLRIDPSRFFRIVLYFIALSCTAYTIAFTVILSGPCNPLEQNSSVCLNNVALAQAMLNITMDSALLVMPMVTIHRLKMERRQKMAVILILAIGSGTVIASCIRIAYIRTMVNNPDVLWTQGSAAIWSAVEINIGILCNCLAMLRPFVRRHLPSLQSFIGIGSRSCWKGKKRARYLHRERRGRDGNGSYELHSFGRDIELGDNVGQASVHIEGGDKVNGGRAAQEEAERLGGILVTKTVSVSRSRDSDRSTQDILVGARLDGLPAPSSRAKTRYVI